MVLSTTGTQKQHLGLVFTKPLDFFPSPQIIVGYIYIYPFNTREIPKDSLSIIARPRRPLRDRRRSPRCLPRSRQNRLGRRPGTRRNRFHRGSQDHHRDRHRRGPERVRHHRWGMPSFGGRETTLPETNELPLKMDGWNTILSYWVSAYFQGRTVSFREGKLLVKRSGFPRHSMGLVYLPTLGAQFRG